MDGAIIIILSIFDFREIDMRRVTQGKQQLSMHVLCIIRRSLFSSLLLRVTCTRTHRYTQTNFWFPSTIKKECPRAAGIGASGFRRAMMELTAPSKMMTRCG